MLVTPARDASQLVRVSHFGVRVSPSLHSNTDALYHTLYHAFIETDRERQRDRETERQRDRETERQRDRETGRQRDRETERQRDRETERRYMIVY